MTIDEKLEKMNLKLEGYINKKNELDEKIKKLKEEIENLNKVKNSKKFDEVSNVIKVKGISFDDLLKAIENNDLLTLQEKIENNAKGDMSDGE